jgi:MarR-like DNA-binding transcriptional regulator SgrR of sgrS sRNA
MTADTITANTITPDTTATDNWAHQPWIMQALAFRPPQRLALAHSTPSQHDLNLLIHRFVQIQTLVVRIQFIAETDVIEDMAHYAKLIGSYCTAAHQHAFDLHIAFTHSPILPMITLLKYYIEQQKTLTLSELEFIEDIVNALLIFCKKITTNGNIPHIPLFRKSDATHLMGIVLMQLIDHLMQQNAHHFFDKSDADCYYFSGLWNALCIAT